MKVLFFALSTLFLSSCMFAPNGNNAGPGLLVTSTTDAVAIGNYMPDATRTGRACSIRIMAIMTFGDASIDAAIKNGQISQVSTVNVEHLNVLSIFGKACSIVKGK